MDGSPGEKFNELGEYLSPDPEDQNPPYSEEQLPDILEDRLAAIIEQWQMKFFAQFIEPAMR